MGSTHGTLRIPAGNHIRRRAAAAACAPRPGTRDHARPPRSYERAGVTRCTWSGRPLNQRFAVDHAIPFSLWANNDLWNLLQVDQQVNANKSDKLPSGSPRFQCNK
ncbi:HNH endonuclease domain-containing protein [Pseudomonas aeruginosa]|uniref:HNH endonuclease domain-containing protein n=1 Tax=Pseudomonas aeruginosa TaxID=287 RepID=UPI003AADF236